MNKLLKISNIMQFAPRIVISLPNLLENLPKLPAISKRKPKLCHPQSFESLDSFVQFCWSDYSGKDAIGIYRSKCKFECSLLVTQLRQLGKVDFDIVDAKCPLKNLKILDVGCGVGYLSEELAKLGAQVTGLDISNNAIEIAKMHHAKKNSQQEEINYVNKSIEDYCVEHKEEFDIVAISNVLENVIDQVRLTKSATECLKPLGFAFVTSANRNFFAAFYYFYICRQFYKAFPSYCVDYDKFLTPLEVTNLFRQSNCISCGLEGYTLNAVTKNWTRIPSSNLHYSLVLLKQQPLV